MHMNNLNKTKKNTLKLIQIVSHFTCHQFLGIFLNNKTFVGQINGLNKEIKFICYHVF